MSGSFQNNMAAYKKVSHKLPYRYHMFSNIEMGARNGKSGLNAANDKVNKGTSQQGRGEAFWGDVSHWGSSLAGVLREEHDSNDVFFGSVQSDIVGVQYYNGTVSNNELVILEREPYNKYDQNAVKVENTGLEQVGHIKREHAKVFAYIMDNEFAKLEGIIPYGANNKFRIPVDIQFWGAQEMKIKVHDYLNSHGMTVQAFETRKSGDGMMPGPSSLPGVLAVDYGHVVSSRTKVTPQEMENELDKMFETLDEGDKTTEIEPDKAIARKMYPHQKQALNWMICKENKDDLPPFWEEQNNVYVNTLTKYMTSVRPNSVHGGILADDMGLGKTLEMISLIMTNFVNGKSLAHPLPGRFRAPFEFTGQMSQKSVSSREGPGINKSQGKSESVDLTLPHSTASTKEFPSPRLVLPKKSTKVVQSVAEKSSENCDEGLATVMRNKEDPVDRPANLESSEVMSASVTRPRMHFFPIQSKKRSARYSFDDDEEGDDNEEKYQPPSKNGRKGKQQNRVSKRLQPSDIIILCEDSDGKIREQQQSLSSSTEPEGKIPPNTAKSGICGLIPDITQALPSTVTNANDSGNRMRKPELCLGGNSSSQSVIEVDDLSDPQTPIVIWDCEW